MTATSHEPNNISAAENLLRKRHTTNHEVIPPEVGHSYSDDGEAGSSSSVSSSQFDEADPVVFPKEQSPAPATPTNATEKTSKHSEVRTPEWRKDSKLTLKERGRIPAGMYVAFLVIYALLSCSGFLGNGDLVIRSVSASWTKTGQRLAHNARKLLTFFNLEKARGEHQTSLGLAGMSFESVLSGLRTISSILLVLSVIHVLVYRPFRAGFWTGRRVRRHRLHRYMGLFYLIQYFIAWVEFLTMYDKRGSETFLPVTIALNGFVQAASAYFSFKVLPALHDPGYYSDKAVISRNFVYENSFFQLMSIWGSCYYNDFLRSNMQASKLGRMMEIIFCFFPYAFIRPFFPITRLKHGGTGRASRTEQNERFYAIGTLMIKIFYLWAKYFLGFFINWMVFLNLYTEQDMHLIRGLFLLNVGTVSIAIFLHTLRFKKVLPPKLTFSLYICQIYATFSAVPQAYEMFSSHRKLAAVTLAGMICNMTRDVRIHTVWCACCLALMTLTDFDW